MQSWILHQGPQQFHCVLSSERFLLDDISDNRVITVIEVIFNMLGDVWKVRNRTLIFKSSLYNSDLLNNGFVVARFKQWQNMIHTFRQKTSGLWI